MFDFLKDTNKRKLFIFNYCVFMINGLLTLSVGSLLPFIRSARGIGYGFAGLIVSLHSVGNLVACFVAGALPAVIGKKKNILFFDLFFALSYVYYIWKKSILVCSSILSHGDCQRGKQQFLQYGDQQSGTRKSMDHQWVTRNVFRRCIRISNLFDDTDRK